jgi:pyruvate dehydrogenase E2 component (dihydrolipoamide acetyltransferase)
MPDVLMPKLSDTMEEGKIIRWLKHRGDKVAIGDILAEVETDKANMEIEAFDEGVLTEIRTAEGEAAPVGGVIAVLGDAAEASTDGQPRPAAEPKAKAPAPQAAKAERPEPERREPDEEEPEPERREPDEEEPAEVRREPAQRPKVPPAATGGRPGELRVRASPLARRRAREAGVDLDGVKGTGPGGRIVERDVEAALAGGRQAEAVPGPRPVVAPSGRRIEPGKMRQTTARRMAEAKRDIPHFYASSDIPMDECARLKEGLAELGGEYDGITYTHLVLKAVGLALRRVPEMNASLDGETIVLHETVHVGLATAVDDGLIVPVVRDCDRQPLGMLVSQVRSLVERARAGKFGAEDLRGGTFTVSNLGMYPVSHFAAVVNPPQAAILAVGAVRAVPVVRGGEVMPGQVMTVTLSCDHRIVDGVLAGRFLRELVSLLGSPLVLVA